MKGFLLAATAFLITAAIFQYCTSLQAKQLSVKSYLSKKKLLAVACVPNANAGEQWLENHPEGIPALEGWGNYFWKVSTNNDSAQFYFNQGINMYYSFHMVESYASFAKATVFDPQLAIAYWGQALSRGPNINQPDITYDATNDALLLIEKAKTNAGYASAMEKQLIEAITKRYSADTTISRATLDACYAAAMKPIFENNNTNAEAISLYADALMVQHPWDLYEQNELPKNWTPPIVSLVEKGLEQFPNHPALNHYYIHVVEASSNPGRAIPSANLLSTLMPMVAHMVHMPSHIYIRTGNYQQGIDVNTSAFTGFSNYRQKFPAVEELAALYLSHNQHMQVACGLMAGEAKYSEDQAGKTKANIPDDYFAQASAFGNYLQSIHMLPFIVNVRFGQWRAILDSPMVKESLDFEFACQLFAKGLASAFTGKTADAQTYLKRLTEKTKTPILHEAYASFANPASATLDVCAEILKATIAYKQGDAANAIKAYQKAVEQEDAMLYNEPKDWLIPARHYLGYALLKSKKYAEAEAVYKADLQRNPANPWSLKSLALAQKAFGKQRDAFKTWEQFAKAAKHADVGIAASIIE
jgi:tetratricopeptide (TPR) repeat protein